MTCRASFSGSNDSKIYIYLRNHRNNSFWDNHTRINIDVATISRNESAHRDQESVLNKLLSSIIFFYREEEVIVVRVALPEAQKITLHQNYALAQKEQV